MAPQFSQEPGRDIDILLVYNLCAALEGELSERKHRRGKPRSNNFDGLPTHHRMNPLGHSKTRSCRVSDRRLLLDYSTVNVSRPCNWFHGVVEG